MGSLIVAGAPCLRLEWNGKRLRKDLIWLTHQFYLQSIDCNHYILARGHAESWCLEKLLFLVACTISETNVSKAHNDRVGHRQSTFRLLYDQTCNNLAPADHVRRVSGWLILLVCTVVKAGLACMFFLPWHGGLECYRESSQRKVQLVRFLVSSSMYIQEIRIENTGVSHLLNSWHIVHSLSSLYVLRYYSLYIKLILILWLDS
jgi:hypothetical protein